METIKVRYQIRGDVAGGAVNVLIATVADLRWAKFLATLFGDTGEFDYGTVAVYETTITEKSERSP